MTPETFLQLTDPLPEPMLLLSEDGIILAANRSLGEQVSRAVADLRNRHVREIVQETEEKIAAYLRVCSHRREPVAEGLVLVGHDGRTLACCTEGYVLRPRSAHVKALVLLRLIPKGSRFSSSGPIQDRIDTLSQEIGRQRQVERELRVQHKWLQITLSSIGDAVIATDCEPRVVFLNPAAAKLTGWEPQEALKQPLEKVFHIVQALSREPAVMPTVQTLSAEATATLNDPMLLITRGGHEIPIAACAAPIRNGQSNILGIVFVFHDISEQRRLENELHQQAQELAAADRRKDVFLAMLAHELRNPLTPILNGLHILNLISADEETRKQACKMMERQIHHLRRLVDDLLEVSRITRGKLHLQHERLDLTQLVRTAAEDHRMLMDQGGLKFSVILPETPALIQGDRTRLAQIIHILLDNAAKFTDRGGQVNLRLTIDTANQQTVLTVQDTGIGIEKQMLSRLFQAFSQADHSLERSRGGLGLGLALIKGLTDLHEGTVVATSNGLGHGATFAIRLPLAEELPALAQEAVKLAPAVRPLRVLIIEDNKDAAQSLCLWLELLGHKVAVAHVGTEGVQLARSWHPNVVLCDIGLPVLDGYGVASALRRNPDTSHIHLIAITGYGQEEDRRRCHAAGFEYHLTKPADPLTLQQVLASLEPTTPEKQP